MITLDIDAIERLANSPVGRHANLVNHFNAAELAAHNEINAAMIRLQDKTAEFYRDELTALCEYARAADARAERAEAALAQARALLDAHQVLFVRLEWAGDDDDNQCPACLNTRKEGHAEKCELAGALSASDGAR